MSKLSKLIDYSFTGNISLSKKPNTNYLDISKHRYETIDPYWGHRKEFILNATIKKAAWLSEDHIISTNENYPAIKNDILNDLKSAMIEEVFGEFRPLIIEMRAAIYDKDDTRIRTLLGELEHKMFFE